ncbi:protein of unknown function [Desulfovibrio sp. 86]|nr:protein of unknown function [Desulfovibrio sp. 86]
MRMHIFKVWDTPVSARNHAGKLRLRLCGERLLAQPLEQFKRSIVLVHPPAHSTPGSTVNMFEVA